MDNFDCKSKKFEIPKLAIRSANENTKYHRYNKIGKQCTPNYWKFDITVTVLFHSNQRLNSEVGYVGDTKKKKQKDGF